MANIGYATLTVVPSIQGVRRSLERQLDPHMKAAGRDAGEQLGQAMSASVDAEIPEIRKQMTEVSKSAERSASRVETSYRRAWSRVSAGARSFGRVFRSAASSIDQDSWRTRNSILLIGTAVNGLVSASLPALATLGTGIAALGSAGVAAGIGVAGVAAVAIPAISDIAEVLKLQEQAADGSAAAAEKLADRMAKLSPAARTLMQDWQGLSAEFHAWSRELQPDVLPVFSDAIGLMSGRFDRLSPLVRDSAAAIRGLIKDADQAMQSPFWDQFLSRVTAQAPTAISGLGAAGGNIAGGAAGVANAFLPSTPAAVGWIEQVTANFREWGQGLGDSQAFRGFMDYVVRVAPTVKAFFASIGPAVANLAVGLAPIGETVLQLGTAFADMIAAAPPEAITAIAGAIALIGATIKGAALVSAIAAIANPIGLTVAAVAALSAGLAVAWNRSETFRDVVSGALEWVQSKAQSVKDYFAAEVWPILRDGWDVLGKAADRGGSAVAWAFEQLEVAGEGMKAFWGPLWDWASRTFGRAFDSLAGLAETGLENVKDVIKVFDAALDGDWSAVWEGAKRILKRSVAQWVDIFKGIGKSWLDGLKTGFRDIPKSLGTWITETVPELAGKLADWTTEFVDWAKEVGPEVLAELRQLGTDIGNWIVNDLPPKIRENLNTASDVMVSWAKSLPTKIGNALTNSQDIASFIIEWGPKISGALAVVAAGLVLAIPIIFSGIGFAIQLVIVTAINQMAKQAAKKLGEAAFGWAATVRTGVNMMVAWVATLPNRIVMWLLNMRNRAFVQLNIWRTGITNRARSAAGNFIGQMARMATGVFNRLTGMNISSSAVADQMKTNIVNAARGLRNSALGVINNFRRGVITAFRAAHAGAAAAWDKMRASTRKPVQYIVDVVYNQGIRGVWNKVAGLVKMPPLSPVRFASGGVMPGYTPGRDPHKFTSPTGGALELSGGESILRPEVTRAWGAGTTNSLNAAARTGGVSGVRDALGFAKGGVYGGAQKFAGGGILGKLDGFAQQAKDLFPDTTLRKASASILNPLLGGMDRFKGAPWGDAVSKLPQQMISKFLNWMEKVVDPKLGGDASKVIKLAKSKVGNFGGSDSNNEFTRAFGMNGLPWCAMFVSKIFKDAKAGKAINGIWSAAVASFNSGMQGVSRGSVRPGDLATYRGSGHINIVTDPKRGETVGGNESNAVRKQYGYMNSATKYLRSKFASGGIYGEDFLRQDLANNGQRHTPPLTQALRASNGIPMYDNGGVLKPGLQMVNNGTGRPETIRTEAQEARIERLVRLLETGGHGTTVNVTPPPATVGELVNGVDYALRRSRRGGMYRR